VTWHNSQTTAEKDYPTLTPYPVRGRLYGSQSIQVDGRKLCATALHLLIQLLHGTQLWSTLEGVRPVLDQTQHSLTDNSGRIVLQCTRRMGSIEHPLHSPQVSDKLDSSMLAIECGMCLPGIMFTWAFYIHAAPAIITSHHHLTDWPTDWLTDWLVDWLTDWLTGLLTVTDWLACWLTDWLIGLLTDWLNYWQTDWLVDWLTNIF